MERNFCLLTNRWVCIFRESSVCFSERGMSSVCFSERRMGKKVLVCVVDVVCGGEEEISRIGKNGTGEVDITDEQWTQQ